MVEPLETVDANWLIQQPRREPAWVVEDLMPTGLHLLTGAPKIGKSWLVLDLALCVSAGRPFWGYATRRCGVLYLALEDTLARIQGRMWGLSDTASERLYFALNSRSIADGLLDQLDEFAEVHEGTGLVIVDTLQKVRAPSRDSAYAADYGDVGALKGFADSHGLAVLAVHHTRKLGDADVFNTVSGTTGITGSADSTFVLAKQGRTSEYATLSLTGRDVEFQELKLRFNDCSWELIEKTNAEELAVREVPDCVLRVLDFIEDRGGEWRGSAAALMAEAGVEGVGASVFGKRLAQHSAFMADRGVVRQSAHTRGRRARPQAHHVTAVTAVAGMPRLPSHEREYGPEEPLGEPEQRFEQLHRHPPSVTCGPCRARRRARS